MLRAHQCLLGLPGKVGVGNLDLLDIECVVVEGVIAGLALPGAIAVEAAALCERLHHQACITKTF